MTRAFLTLLAFCSAAAFGLDSDPSIIKCPSPNGRFALRITEPKESETADPNVDLIEKASGKVVADLGTAYRSHLRDTVLVWSADSKWVAYATRGEKQGDTTVHVWDGSAFTGVTLPDTLPDPQIKFARGAGDSVKNYGGAVTPVRWLKSGGLMLSSEQTMLSRVDGRSYTGTVVFTIAFDAQHHATVQKVEKTKTRIDEYDE